METYHEGFPSDPVVKNMPCNAGDTGSVPGLGRSQMPQSNEACEPQQLKPTSLEPMLWSKRSLRNEKPTHQSWRAAPTQHKYRESPHTGGKTQCSRNRQINRHFSKEDIKMGKKLRKTCSMSVIIRKMQIETTMMCHLTPVRMAIIKKLQTVTAGEGVVKREPSCTVGRNVNWCSHNGEQYGDSLKN